MITHKPVTADTLNAVMEFDHPVQVDADGVVSNVSQDAGVYAPNLQDGQLDDPKWSFFTHGYSGQSGYSGPIMHNSEYIGGNLARDILATPGIYAAVAAYWTSDESDDADGDTVEGWAVVRLNDTEEAA